MEDKRPEKHLKLVKPRKKVEEKKTKREISIERILKYAEKLKW